MASLPRTSRLVALGAGLLLGLGAAGTAAAAVQNPVPIGPGQFFSGVVNGQVGTAPLQTDCVGPLVPGQTGHPLSGQYVEAILSTGSTTTTGYTGTAADSLLVTLGPAASTTAQLIGTLHDYYVPLAIPTTLTVPCAGTGTIAFTPEPASTTAKPATVTVNFLPQP